MSSSSNDLPGWVSPAGIISLVAGWLVTNVIIAPVNYTVAYGEWALETALGTVDSAIRTSLGTAGSSIYQNALIGPRNAIFGAIRGLVGAGGIASPLVVGITLAITTGLVVLVTVVVIRYFADYIPGGSRIQ